MNIYEDVIRYYQDRLKYHVKYLYDAYHDKQNHPELFTADMTYIGRGSTFIYNPRDCTDRYGDDYYNYVERRNVNNDLITEGFTLDINGSSMIFKLPNGKFKAFHVYNYIENYGRLSVGMGFKPRIPTTQFSQSKEYHAKQYVATHENVEDLDTSGFTQRGEAIYSNKELR